MARVAVSVRFPEDLANVLDQLAQRRGCSRSDLVEGLIGAVDAEDRAAIIETTTGAPTEKRNLSLSREALQRLKELAGDIGPADFVRRMIACAANVVCPGWQRTAASSGEAEDQGPAPARSRMHSRRFADDDPKPEITGVPIGLIIMAAVLILAALVSFVVWFLSERRSQPPDRGPRGQLSDGNSDADHA